MNRYVIQWRGAITRDVGAEEIDANTEAEAKAKFWLKYRDRRQVVAISLACQE